MESTDILQALLSKLLQTFQAPVFEERWATHFLTQVRKMVEYHRQKDDSRYAILNLFCNWPMHIRIDRDPKNIRLFFDAFDFKDGMEVEEVLRSNYFREFVLLNSFRRSLGEFLREHAVPNWLTNDTDNWHTFVYLYAGIVGPSPLVYTKDDILPSEVAELRVDRYKAANMDQEYVRAQVLLKNGRDYFSMHIAHPAIEELLSRLGLQISSRTLSRLV